VWHDGDGIFVEFGRRDRVDRDAGPTTSTPRDAAIAHSS